VNFEPHWSKLPISRHPALLLFCVSPRFTQRAHPVLPSIPQAFVAALLCWASKADIRYNGGAYSAGNLSYSYDLNGRRAGVSGTLATTQLPAAVNSATYNADNQLTALTLRGEILAIPERLLPDSSRQPRSDRVVSTDRGMSALEAIELRQVCAEWSCDLASPLNSGNIQ
jgi:hypothetical protein